MADGTDEELHAMVLSIVNELEDAASGNLYRMEDGEFECLDSDELDDYLESHDAAPEQASVADVIEKRGLGDTRFEVDTSKELCGGKTLFTCGGPTIWVYDTEVHGCWGASVCTISFNEETRNAMFDWFREYWEVVGS